MKSKDEVDWLKNVLKNALPNKTVKSDLVLTSAPIKSEDNAISETADFCLKLSMTINDGIGE